MVQITDLGTPTSPNGKDVLVPPSRASWRRWLEEHPDRVEGIWVVYRKKTSGVDGPVYDDLLEEALCFGWIDSRLRRIDIDRVMQWFSPRRSGGLWSAPNKERIERLERRGLMTERGRMAIEEAKADGSWTQTEEIDALVVPADLAAALAADPDARRAFDDSSDSAKKQYLWWIHSAKRAATRADRVEATVRLLGSQPDNGSN